MPIYLVVASHQFPLRVKDNVGVVLIATVAGAAGITGITRLLVPDVGNHVDGVIPGHAAESLLHWSRSKSNVFLVKEKLKKFDKFKFSCGRKAFKITVPLTAYPWGAEKGIDQIMDFVHFLLCS